MCRLALPRDHSRGAAGPRPRGAPNMLRLTPNARARSIRVVQITFDVGVETFERFNDEQTQHHEARHTGCRGGTGRRHPRRLRSRRDSGDGSGALTFWHNSTTGPGKAYWEETAKEFEAEHPGVDIKIQAIQNEDMDGKLQTALNSGDAPDIFMARGGGKLAAVVEAGQVQDLTDALSDDTKSALGEASLAALLRRRQGLRRAVLRAARRHLLQQGPVRPGGHHRDADHVRRAGRRRRQAQGRGHRPDRPRRQGRMARGALVLLLLAARVLAGRHGRARRRTRASRTSASCGPARTSRTSPRPSRTTRASSPPPRSRAPAPPRASSPTTRRPWSSWARGIPE